MDSAAEAIRTGLEAGSECLEAALDYARRGWSALAVCPPDHVGVGATHGRECDSPGKAPWGPWKEYQDRPATEEELRAKWRALPNANVGLALGPASGLVGVDVDGEQGEALLQELSQGDVPETLEFKTGKGRRLLYHIPEGVKLRPTHRHGGEAGQGLSLLAYGSQTVMPPSRHKSGRRYEWTPGKGPGEIEAAPAPGWVVYQLAEETRPARSAESGEPGAKFTEGKRNNSLTSLAGGMRRRGMGEASILAALEAENCERCDPPLSDADVAKIAHSVAQYKPDALAGVTLKFSDLNGQHPAPAEPGKASDPWEPPVPFALTPAPTFPAEVLPGPVRDMAEAVASAMPCPLDMTACFALAAAASAVGNTRELHIKGSWRERCRIWLAVVAKPGSKKSPAAGAMLRPVRLRQREMRNQYGSDHAAYQVAVEKWQGQPKEERLESEKPRPPVERQAYTIDATREALADLLAENPRGILMHRDELTGWALSHNQYKQGKGDDKQFYLSLWSGEDIVVNRRGRKVFVEDPFVCVSGNLPPGVLQDLNDERNREDGFIHRLLFAWPDPVRGGWTDAEPRMAVVEAYEEFFDRLYKLTGEAERHGRYDPQTVMMTRAAREAFADLVNGIARDLASDEFPDGLRGPWSKLEGYGARLCLLLHVCRQAAPEGAPEVVDEQTVADAARLVTYFQASARRVYPLLLDATAERDRENADAILAWVRRHRQYIEEAEEGKPAGAFGWRTLRRQLYSRFGDSEETMTRALRLLEQRGYLRESPRQRAGNSGRLPKPDYFVSPLTW